jgi:hypothetical protein
MNMIYIVIDQNQYLYVVKRQIQKSIIEQELNIYNVMEVLENMNKHPLKHLYLPYNGWESIPNDMFNSFEDSNIRLINLREICKLLICATLLKTRG